MQFPQSDRELQALRGLWGFIPYAGEFWCTALCEMIAYPRESWSSEFLTLAADISGLLEGAQAEHGTHLSSDPIFEELQGIESFPGLWHNARIELQAHLDRKPLRIHRDTTGL